MFIELQNGSMLNIFWLTDCFQGKHNKNIVIFYMINGSKITEEYSSVVDAKSRVDEVQAEMSKAGGLSTRIVQSLPQIGQENVVYLVPTQDQTDMFAEWVYVNNEWNPWGVKKIDLDALKTEIENEVLTKTNTTSYTPTANYHPATKKYVDDNCIPYQPFPDGLDTSHTTSDFITSIRALNLPAGSTYLGGVTLTDMPFNGNAEVEIYIYPNNVVYLTLRSANISPYLWECNSHTFRGWEAVGKSYADTNFLNKTNTTSYTPTADYHPATKKYVDDAISTNITNVLNASY